MSSSVFMTGFPGFIGRRLIDRLLGKEPDARFTFLIEERLRDLAKRSIQELDAKHSGFADRVEVVTGDIAAPKLGMSDQVYREAVASTTHVWHLAAIYNLAVPASLAYRVNVIGTANVLDFCEDCKKLKRLDYVSTCYVCGDRKGEVFENELDEGQRFKNHYESTKAWAEMEVRRRMHKIPTAIHRPAVVVGDSRTGETDKYDGPYFMIQLLMKLPRWVPMVNIGAGKAHVNIVPVDFVVDAMAEIWSKPESLGQTFQLASPEPRTAYEVMEAMLQRLGYRKPKVAVPSAALEGVLSIGPVRNLVKIPKETVVYFDHEVRFDTTHQEQILEGTGVSCPDLLEYLPTLIDYVKRYPEKPFLDGRAF